MFQNWWNIIKLLNILEPHVVKVFWVQNISLCAIGMPSKGRWFFSWYLRSDSLAFSKARSSVTVI